MTAILGLSAYYHDSAAALVVDGHIVAASQEERFSRRKHDASFPRRAIDYCLATAGLQVADLDYVGFYDKPLLKFDRLLASYLATAPRGFASFLHAMPLWLRDKLFLPTILLPVTALLREMALTIYQPCRARPGQNGTRVKLNLTQAGRRAIRSSTVAKKRSKASRVGHGRISLSKSSNS